MPDDGQLHQVAEVVVASALEHVALLHLQQTAHLFQQGLGHGPVIEKTGRYARAALPQAAAHLVHDVLGELLIQVKLRVT